MRRWFEGWSVFSRIEPVDSSPGCGPLITDENPYLSIRWWRLLSARGDADPDWGCRILNRILANFINGYWRGLPRGKKLSSRFTIDLDRSRAAAHAARCFYRVGHTIRGQILLAFSALAAITGVLCHFA